MKQIVAFCLILSGLLCLPHSSLDLGNILRPFLISSIIFLSCFCAGSIVLTKISKTDGSSNLFLAFLLGYTFLSLLLVLSIFLLPLYFKAVFWVLAATSIIYCHRNPVVVPKIKFEDCSLIIVIFLAAIFWSQDAINPWLLNDDQVIFKPWRDAFNFASNIISFKNIKDSSISLAHLSGIPLRPYHYSAFMLPTIYSIYGNLSSLDAICQFFTPLSLILLGFSAALLGRTFAPKNGAILAVIFALLVPDPSFYGIKHPWFGYFWLLQVSPGLSSGIVTASISLYFSKLGIEQKNLRFILYSTGFSLLTCIIKFQVFTVIFPALSIWMIFFYPGIKLKWRALLFGCFVGLSFFTLYLVSFSQSLPQLRLNPSWAFNHYFMPLVVNQWPQNWSKVIISTLLIDAKYFEHLSAVPLLFLASFGLVGVLFALTIFYKLIRQKLVSYDYLTIFLLFTYLSYALLLDRLYVFSPEEIHHRSVVFLYFIISIYLAINIAEFLNYPKKLLIISLLALLFPFYLGSGIHKPSLAWAGNFASVPFNRDLYDCATFIKSKAKTGEVIQDSNLDEMFMIAGLSDKPEYISNIDQHPKLSELLNQRKMEVLKLTSLLGSEEAKAHAESLGVNWLVLSPSRPELEKSAEFNNKSCQVFHFH